MYYLENKTFSCFILEKEGKSTSAFPRTSIDRKRLRHITFERTHNKKQHSTQLVIKKRTFRQKKKTVVKLLCNFFV